MSQLQGPLPGNFHRRNAPPLKGGEDFQPLVQADAIPPHRLEDGVRHFVRKQGGSKELYLPLGVCPDDGLSFRVPLLVREEALSTR